MKYMLEKLQAIVADFENLPRAESPAADA